MEPVLEKPKTRIKKVSTQASTPSTENSLDTKKNDYFELKLPKLDLLKKINTPLPALWVILLLILSYLLGMQTAKLTYIEEKMNEAGTIAQNPGQNNPGPPSLGAKVDIKEGTLPALGGKNPKVTMVEFSDFQCPFCERFYKETFPQLKKDYIDTGKIKFTFRHLPLEIHPLAPKAAEASECANDQGKFWDYHDILFENFTQWSSLTLDTLSPQLETYATDLGLDTQEFSTCLSTNKHAGKVNEDKTDGQAAGATGTPSFFINGKILVGAMPYETFKTLLDEELKK